MLVLALFSAARISLKLSLVYCVALPLLALALGLLDWREGEKTGTDGRFFYAPISFLEQAVKKPGPAEKTLLHSVLHAMLLHPWQRGGVDAQAWSLACDMTVGFLAKRLLGQTLDETQAKAFYALRKGTAFSASAVCAQLDGDFPVPRETLRALFAQDDHALWNAAQEQARLPVSGADGAGAPALWRRQREKLLPFMQEEKPKIGTGTAGVALIEPLEYSEERKLRELAIVIDTSASCSRGLTGWFLRAVHDILLRERLFFDRFRLHILQCDCEVQQDTLVTNLEEFQWYLDHLELYGGGGTDFRPALRRIDELVACGELPHLGGVLYFTDGYGVFPEREPAYPVAFVMLRYRYDDINIPRWAIRLVLDADKPGRDEGWI